VKTTSKKIPIALVGFGSQGRRVAEAISCQKDMKLIGVALCQPDTSAYLAMQIGHPIYFVDPINVKLFEKSGIPFQGSIEELLSKVDLVVDCTPAGVGKQNKEKFYRKFGVKAIFQAGENLKIAGIPAFISSTNYENAHEAMFVRMATPSATALTRTIMPLKERFGVKYIACTLVKAGSETMRAHQGPIDTLVPEPPQRMRIVESELNKMLEKVRIYLSSIRVPSLLLDVQSIFVKLTQRACVNAVTKTLEKAPRVVLIESERGLFSTDAIFEFFRRIRPFSGDIFEVCIWEEQIEINDQIVKLTQTIDPHSVHIPELIDAIRAMTTKTPSKESSRRTDRTLQIMRNRFKV